MEAGDWRWLYASNQRPLLVVTYGDVALPIWINLLMDMGVTLIPLIRRVKYSLENPKTLWFLRLKPMTWCPTLPHFYHCSTHTFMSLYNNTSKCVCVLLRVNDMYVRCNRRKTSNSHKKWWHNITYLFIFILFINLKSIIYFIDNHNIYGIS
jgi:hypothetical protein